MKKTLIVHVSYFFGRLSDKFYKLGALRGGRHIYALYDNSEKRDVLGALQGAETDSAALSGVFFVSKIM